MATLWYYAHDEKKLGPFTQQTLKELAAAGTILPMDTVWQEGVEQGVEAHRIKNLFPRPRVTSTDEIDHVLGEEAEPPPAEPPPEKTEPAKATPKTVPKVKKGRAVAMKGCDIVSQDGSYARYRMKCIKCGHLDSACHTIVISNRLTKLNYFCPKCRKRREVAIQCQLQ